MIDTKNQSKVALITYWGNWTSWYHSFTLKDLNIKINHTRSAYDKKNKVRNGIVITDVFDPEFRLEVFSIHDTIWTGTLWSHQSRVFKIRKAKLKYRPSHMVMKSIALIIVLLGISFSVQYLKKKGYVSKEILN